MTGYLKKEEGRKKKIRRRRRKGKVVWCRTGEAEGGDVVGGFK